MSDKEANIRPSIRLAAHNMGCKMCKDATWTESQHGMAIFHSKEIRCEEYKRLKNLADEENDL